MVIKVFDERLNHDHEFYEMNYGEEAIYEPSGFLEAVENAFEEEGFYPDENGDYPTLDRMNFEGILTDIIYS